MNIGRYPELKRQNLVRLQPLGDQVIAISKTFDPDTGMMLKEQAIPMDEVKLAQQKTTLEMQLAALTELIEDIEEAKK